MSALINRSPVTGSKQDIFAYRLGFCPGSAAGAGPLSYLAPNNSDQGEWLLKDQHVMMTLSDLPGDQLDRNLCEHIIVAIESDTADETLKRAQTLKADGFGVHVALNPDQPLPQQLFQIANYISVPSNCGNLQAASKALRKFSAKQIARAINRQEEFQLAREAGIDFVDGYYFSNAVVKATKAVSPAYASIITVMQLAQQNAPIQKIEDALKRDAALSFRLLRYINSAGLGLSCEISSFRHAVTIIGYQNLSRWLGLLLVSAAKDAGCPALMTTAVVRGRLTELLGASFFDKQERDNLFIVGVFSMLDIMLSMPMDEILNQIPLDESIADALINHQGNYGAFLELAQCCERLDEKINIERAKTLMDSLQLTSDQVNRAHMQALGWSENLAL
jgi:EAL and modified HD-GYP domain-containing signal transduction protein